jgi:4-hydroxyproline epimerase
VPNLAGKTMFERRQHFLEEFDWVRTALTCEPRGNDMMVAAILYPPTRADCDVGMIFVETTGSMPMCGHGTIGAVTTIIEHGLYPPRTPGIMRLDTPAGLVEAHYTQNGPNVENVRLTNVPSFLYARNLEVEVAGLGLLTVDLAYGGNFYAIVEPQELYTDLADIGPLDIVRWSTKLRTEFNKRHQFSHPEYPDINKMKLVMWTGKPTKPGVSARNAVFYGEKAIDRSPCGTGTSARMAQLYGTGRLKPNESFVHESIIGSTFECHIEGVTKVGKFDAIIPSIQGWAHVTSVNTIYVDDRDPYSRGFLLAG